MLDRNKWNHNWIFRRDSRGRFKGKVVECHDDYSEDSGNKNYDKREQARFSTDKCDPKSLNGPVIIVQEGRKKNEAD
jgi:hypothetical protein